ncbi:cell wall metabolism sensor histidine kinase WalK [Paenibacillus sp. CFBP13512]|uniref:cell wall metabolism sensor histidine kinase WalK n=1 Tax=Paenibacillus sp. CFBP13512 TaxID=2184007 RepID=UPI0010BF69AD|nr:cell wall metabolism sensor histidine kinase WalK [Paenibacillus sp. CFBP13512]TKJ88931.1 cell wall metabolism sensor histidine kinase WalK [Paenibacillus sp. CFBP13512]
MKRRFPLLPGFSRTIQARLIIIYVLLILIAMQLIGVYFVSAMKNSLTSNFTQDLQERAELLSVLAADKWSGSGEAGSNAINDLKLMVDNLYNMSGTEIQEIQVLDISGRVVISSLESGTDLEGRRNTQTVVSRALQGISDNEEYIIDETGERKRVVAKPVISGGKTVGAVYIVASMKELYSTMKRINSIFLSGILIALALTAVLGVILAHTITQPIKEMTRRAKEVAEGNFDHQMTVYSDDEIGQLSEAFNYMTSRLRDALAQNEEEKDKLASILKNMSDGVVATDEQGRVILMNRVAGTMMNVSEEEIVGKELADLLYLPENERTKLLQGTLRRTVLKLGEEHEGNSSIVRVTFSPIHRRKESITGIIAVLQDVTEQEKLEGARREFVANVSHELRTPLTTIKSYTEALEDGALEERALAERFIGVIQNETQRMIRLVTDLLHLSRLDSSEAMLRKQRTDVRELLEDTIDRFSVQMQQKDIKSATDLDADVGSVWIDRDHMDQVLDNLVSNSLKYTPDGGKVTLGAYGTEDGMVAITVTDTGIGIPKQDLNRIFERFYRVDKARSRNMGGTGLGLSIAREMVFAHEGHISLESEFGQWTKVTVTLPLHEEGDGAH